MMVDEQSVDRTEFVEEGIEMPAELRTLAGLGVDLLQRFRFARPHLGFVEIDAAVWDELN